MNPSPCLCLLVLALTGCRPEAPPAPPAPITAQPTNRIDVPAPVRTNLGIRFVKVERRRVAHTLRVPGHFELLPSARREYRVPGPGRVDIAVGPLQEVKAGDVLFRLDSPTWRTLQRELGELTTQAQVTAVRLDAMRPLLQAHRVHEDSLADALRVMQERVAGLEATRASVGGQAAELTSAKLQVAQVRADLTEAGEKHAEAEASLAELEANLAAAHDRFTLALSAASAIVSIAPERLRAPAVGATLPLWRTIDNLEVHAASAGIVDLMPVASGGWVETGSLVLATADVSQVRFRARGLQSDLARLRTGMPALIVSPRSSAGMQPLRGTLELGVDADPEQRTIDLFVRPDRSDPMARPGIAALLEIETTADQEPELAVPLSAVLPDGLQRVLFRRDPKDPDKVIRLEGDLGRDDGRWIEVKSGLRDGDEVVLEGAYELMLASSGTVARGGHFHADGTFHGDDHK